MAANARVRKKDTLFYCVKHTYLFNFYSVVLTIDQLKNISP